MEVGCAVLGVQWTGWEVVAASESGCRGGASERYERDRSSDSQAEWDQCGIAVPLPLPGDVDNLST